MIREIRIRWACRRCQSHGAAYGSSYKIAKRLVKADHGRCRK